MQPIISSTSARRVSSGGGEMVVAGTPEEVAQCDRVRYRPVFEEDPQRSIRAGYETLSFSHRIVRKKGGKRRWNFLSRALWLFFCSGGHCLGCMVVGRSAVFIQAGETGAVPGVDPCGTGRARAGAHGGAAFLGRCAGAPFERILIADCGLDERGRALARQLERQYAAVRLCTMEDAEAYVRSG